MSNQNNYLITGATSGIGKAIINKLIDNKDNKLFLTSRSSDSSLEQIVSKTITYHSEIDLRELHKRNDIIEKIDSFFDESFTIIHCAGDFWDHLPFLEVSTERASSMMESHYGTLYSTLQAALPLLIKKGGGKILTFSCNAVNYNFPNMLPFNAAKAAVEATIKCIAHEYAKHNIVANAIALSSLQTQKVKESKPNGDYEHYINLSDISDTVLEIANLTNHLANGNVINCYQYSESYYNSGYFQRIKQRN